MEPTEHSFFTSTTLQFVQSATTLLQSTLPPNNLLDDVHNTAIRLATGVFRISPIIRLLYESGECLFASDVNISQSSCQFFIDKSQPFEIFLCADIRYTLQRPNTVYLCANTINSSAMVNYLCKCRPDVTRVWKNYMCAHN